jgi:2-polyprenyl-3-methyl-5-hydroxy-6-metoxy-1,4-benzoquinol methylase
MNIEEKPYDKKYFEGIIGRTAKYSQRNRNRLQAILKNKKSGRLLEIGSGKGEFLRLAEAYFSIEGIDISEYAVDSSKRFLNRRISRKNIENAKLSRNTYDVVAAYNVLEHLIKPKLVIRKIFNALKDKGLLIGSVPHNANLVGRIYTELTKVFDPTHISTFKPRRWKAILKESGFGKMDLYGEFMFGKDLNAYLRNSLWKIFALNLVFECVK